MSGRRASARKKLKLVSDAPVARTFETSPDAASGLEMLAVINARAPAGSPVQPRGRALVLYGAGALGRMAKAHLDLVGQPIAAVLDVHAAAYQEDPHWAGVPVLAPDAAPDALKHNALMAIAIVSLPYVPLHQDLVRQGWGTCVPFHDVAESFTAQHPLHDGWFAAPLTAEQMVSAGGVMAGFADDASRGHYLRFAAWRLGRQEWDFADAPVVAADRFFIPQITAALRPDERFLDAGAHHGHVTARLLALTEGAVSTVWAMEPDAASRAVLQSYVDGLDLNLRARVNVLDAVIGARTELVRFHDGLGQASQIASTGRTLRACAQIDALGLDPTFIKLNLEGGELAALQGARETLRRRRPLLAATVSHDAAGLIETPQWLMANLPDYAFLMRTHAWCGTGAVLYAIPKERMPS